MKFHNVRLYKISQKVVNEVKQYALSQVKAKGNEIERKRKLYEV